MDSVPPLTVIAFLTPTGDTAHKGILVTRDSCPDIKCLSPGKQYILTSSTRSHSDVGFHHFLHLQAAADVLCAVEEGLLAGVAEIRAVPLRRNPWLQRPNESKTDAKKRRKRVAAALRKLLWRYVTVNSSDGEGCLCFESAPALTWIPMEMVTGSGWVASDAAVPPDMVWGQHEFNSEIVYVTRELQMY